MHSKSVQVCIPGCTCPCHHEKILTFNRPSMNDLIDLLKNRDWKAIQEALQLDRTIAMRMEDSPEEDAWFHDVKKLYALRKWRNYKRSKIENQDDHRWKDVTKTEESILGNGKNGANSDEQGVLPPGDSTQLRYWVNSHGQQKRTLLHIICRHYLLPDEGLLAELKAGETEGLMDVMQAARTAEMLVRASHNLSVDWNEVKDDETKCNNQSETMGGECDEHCMDCPCLFYHHYCPPVKQPPVECIAGIESKKRQSIWQNLISGKDLTSTEGVQDDFVLHESVLTMTDAMGETPLHALTGAGSCNVELVKAIVKSCRPLESICLEMCHDGKDNLKAADNNTVSLEWCNSSAPLAKNDDLNSFRLIDNQIASSRGGAFEIDHDRRPTVHDLLSCRSGHGCTPVHFVADKCFEEVLVLLLEQCPPSSPYYTKPNSSTTYEPLHPTMMADNDGDLPLHFAASNGASSNILHILTISMGDARSALVRNSQGRLAIDDTYVWYTETLDIFDESDENDTTDNENSTVFEVDERNNDDADLGASSDHEHVSHECVPGDQRNNNIERLDKDSVQSMQEKIHFCLAHGTVNPLEILREKFSHLFNQDAENITHWRNELWGRMLVLIEAAAKALVPSSSLNPFGPVHAAVLATKYGNFPPIALVASLLADHQPSTSTGHLSHHIHERKCFRRMRELCSMKSRDYLPLHLACCDKFFFSNDLRQSNKRILEATQKLAYPRNPSESNSMSLDRWNNADFPFSMVYFLLYLWPFAAKIPTKNGRLPLHLALECNRADDFTVLPVYGNVLFGYTMERSDIMALLKACPEALHTPDITTHLYPFQTASASTSTMACNLSREEAAFNAGNDVCSINELERATRLLSLENTYRLIMEDPSLCRKIGRIGGGL